MAIAVGDDYFDGTDPASRIRRHMRTARALGVDYLRCAFSWNAIEKSPGVYDWRFWDQLVSLAEANHVHLIPYVAYTPEWAARSGKDFWKQPPRDPELLARFMGVLAARYRGRIRSWEIWNEPDIPEYWQGSAAEFARMVSLAAPSIRHADPAASIVLGGMSLGPGPFFEELISRHHVERYVDVIAMHGYPETWLEDRTEQVYGPNLERMIAIVGKDAPAAAPALWLNEMGYADYRFAPGKASMWGISVQFEYEHTRRYAAASLLKAEIMALASGHVALAGWYRIDDLQPHDPRQPAGEQVNFHLGLLDIHGRPKPAYFALRLFRRELGGPVRLVHQEQGSGRSDRMLYVFQKDDGTVIVAGWLRSARRDEVSDRSGRARDHRREMFSVPLPCRATPALRAFDDKGRPASPGMARVSGHELRRVTLRGDRIFLAHVSCAANQSTPAAQAPAHRAN